MRKTINKKIVVIGILFVFLGSSTVAGIENPVLILNKKTICPVITTNTTISDVPITLAVYGKSPITTHTTIVSAEDAEKISVLFKELKTSIALYPFDERTEQLKQDFITMLARSDLLPEGVSPDQYTSLLNPPWFETLRKHHLPLLPTLLRSPSEAGSAAALFCSLSGEGIGILFPFVMLPRPRILTAWSSLDGNTIVGKLLTIGGFAAGGAQFGFALGFWGIGLAYATPYGTLYGFIGYSLFASVTAGSMERFPPDYPPEIISVEPMDTAVDVPLSLSELRFSIEDPSGDLMSYEITTDPDIGTGTGNLKPAGTYSIPVQGAKSNTEYRWTLKVSDDVQTTEQTFSFTTEAIAPIVSDERPLDGDRYVLETQAALSFHLRDPQHDLMSYTVETSPFIGSGSGSGISEGEVTVPITGLAVMTEYHWFVNVTDGENPTSEAFYFRTGPQTVFDPFEEGWMYRKMITIDHSQVAEDLENYPLLLKITDLGLQEKAQDDGDDILFMSLDDGAVLTRLYHEIERFDGSTGDFVAWVKIPHLSPSVDTEFFMYYGNQYCSNQQYPDAVWDAHYMMVQHMNQPTIQHDSTIHQNNAVPLNNPMTQINGFIGYAVDVEKDMNQYFNCGHDASLNIGDSALTLEAWYTPESLGDGTSNNYYRHLFCRWNYQNENNRCYTLTIREDTARMMVSNSGDDSGSTIAAADGIQPGLWYYQVGRLNGDELALFLNGVRSAVTTHTGGIYQNDQTNVYIGDNNDGINVESFDGLIDEIRISDSARSDGWIQTTFTNLHDPLSFSLVGSEEPHP